MQWRTLGGERKGEFINDRTSEEILLKTDGGGSPLCRFGEGVGKEEGYLLSGEEAGVKNDDPALQQSICGPETEHKSSGSPPYWN